MNSKNHHVDILRSHQYVDRQEFWEKYFPEKSLKYMKVMETGLNNLDIDNNMENKHKKSKFQERLDDAIAESNKIKEDKYGDRDKEMTQEEALSILISHQDWRMGNEGSIASNPKELTKAVDYAIIALKHHINMDRILESVDVYEKPKQMIVSDDEDFLDSDISMVYGKFNDEYLTRTNNQDSCIYVKYKYAKPLKKKFTLKELADKAGLNIDDIEVIE